ncbi:MAG: polysaccharide deacetylase family protein [Thermovirgaceae bacterium]
MGFPRKVLVGIGMLVAAIWIGTFLVSSGGASERVSSLGDILGKYADQKPRLWGEDIPGVLRTFEPDGKQVALTLDACGGPRGSGYDEEIVDFLRENEIPATLFLNARWIEANPEIAADLASDPLFLIANHGWRHRPCSVTGRSAWGIEGTKNLEEAYREIERGAAAVRRLTGKRPRFYRSGTNYYDEVAVAVVRDLGMNVVGWSVLGDEGATLPAEKVAERVFEAKPGQIILCHMNQPDSGTAEGLTQGIRALLEKGFRFVTLDEIFQADGEGLSF